MGDEGFEGSTYCAKANRAVGRDIDTAGEGALRSGSRALDLLDLDWDSQDSARQGEDGGDGEAGELHICGLGVLEGRGGSYELFKVVDRGP